MSTLTKAQAAALGQIANGEVRQHRFGYGAWRILGASPTVVGRLVSLGFAAWGPTTEDDKPCAITEAGRKALGTSHEQ